MKPKRGKRLSKTSSTSRRPVEDEDSDEFDVPDPKSRSYVYDEVDEFAASSSRRGEKDDSESDYEDPDDKVVGFKDIGAESSDSEDEFYEEQMARIKRQLRRDEIASDLEDEDEDEEEAENKGAGDAWGRRIADFRGADVIDKKDEERAKMEEEEAGALRARIAKDFDEADFDIAQFLPEGALEEDKGKEKDKVEEKKVKKDLSKLTKAQKLHLVKQESPELLHLLSDFQEKLNEMETLLKPALDKMKKGHVSEFLRSYVAVKYDITANYCVNLSFYLALKSNRTPVANHPIVKRLLGIRKLLKELAPADAKFLPLVEKFLQADISPVVSKKLKKSKKKVEGEEETPEKPKKKKKTKTELDLVESEEDEPKKSKKKTTKEEPEIMESEEELEDEEIEEEQKVGKASWEVEEGEKRAISYQIAKNKGLTAHKKKEMRNPRVKHRMKYRKAKIRRKGQVREVRQELQRYGGEISGVKAGVVKSVKFK